MISDCGELAPGEDEGVCSADDSGDQIPDWPEDSQVDFSNVHASIFDFFFFIETFKSLFNPQRTLSGRRTISKVISKLQVGKKNIQSSMIDVTDMDVHYCISV